MAENMEYYEILEAPYINKGSARIISSVSNVVIFIVVISDDLISIFNLYRNIRRITIP